MVLEQSVTKIPQLMSPPLSVPPEGQVLPDHHQNALLPRLDKA